MEGLTRSRRLTAATLVLALTACTGTPARQGGEGEAGEPGAGPPGMMGRGRMPMMGGDMMGEPADTAAAPRPRAARAEAPGCPAVTQALVDEGRRIFTGGGNCYACHGSDARGTQVAPDLTDATWLDTDGSYGAIAGLVRSGVTDPKQFAAPMPALGGGEISDPQVCQVAAYVYALSH